MKNFILDIGSMVGSFTLVDYILFFSVVILIMLFVSLIYVMIEERSIKKEMQESTPSIMEKDYSSSSTELDLLDIMNTIDENPKPLIDMTAYEEEQEQKAIISYDELIHEARKNNIHYEEEELVDDLIPVKKISLTQSPSVNEFKLTPKEPKIEVDVDHKAVKTEIKLFSYEKEEAFLKALRELNELLN